MRLSVDEFNAPTEELKRRCLITVDGKTVERCTVADEDAGYVETFEVDEKGFVCIDPLYGLVLTRRIYGKVRIIDPRELNLTEVYLK